MSKSAGTNWKAATVWFEGRAKREKWILVGALFAVVWALIDALWLTPLTRDYKTQAAAVSQKQSELAQLESDSAAIREAVRVREIELRRNIDDARRQLTTVTGELAEFEKALVPAQQMPQFLQSLVPGAGVEIVALRTLPPVPLLLRAARKDAAPGKDAALGKASGVKGEGPAANIYKHGMEITLAGNYDGLLRYLARLEQSSQKVLWGRLELRVEKHPQNELVLVLYTLSLDPSWLAV